MSPPFAARLDDPLTQQPGFPAVVERGTHVRDAIRVGSWPFELVYIGTQRCPCGGRFRPLTLQIRHRGDQVFERQKTVCLDCERNRAFWFDIGAFHDDPEASRRFDDFQCIFESALAALEDENLAVAQAQFQELAAREPWFGLAHFHLGMIALMQEELACAREHLELAVGLMPMDANVHQGLAQLWPLLGEDQRAVRAAWLSMVLEDEAE